MLIQDSSSTTDSSTKVAYSHSAIAEILQCPICLDRFNDPRALPCQHVFCCSCLKIITSTNKLCSMITCPLCRLIFPHNKSDQFPVSYVHNQLRDLVPDNYETKGKCSKCKEIHLLNFCPCCDYYLCEKCFKNDRENTLIHLENIVQTYFNSFDVIPTLKTLETNDLLQRAVSILKNRQKAEYNDALLIFYRLKYIYDELNTLPVTRIKRTYENGDDEDVNLLERKQMRIEPIICLSDQEQIDGVDDDDDEIIYIETKQTKNTSAPD